MVDQIKKLIENQRKYKLAWFFSIAGTYLAIVGTLSILYIEFAAIILGIYGVSNVSDKYVANRNKPTEE